MGQLVVVDILISEMTVMMGITRKWVDFLVVQVINFNEREEVEFDELFMWVLFLLFFKDWVHDELRVLADLLGMLSTQ